MNNNNGSNISSAITSFTSIITAVHTDTSTTNASVIPNCVEEVKKSDLDYQCSRLGCTNNFVDQDMDECECDFICTPISRSSSTCGE